MDIAICQPYLERGGAEQVILQIARKYNPVIYVSRHSKNATYHEFSEFDVRVIKSSGAVRHISTLPWIGNDERLGSLGLAGWTFLNAKIKDDYDILNAHMMPSEWIRNRNERVCWYCHCPCRPAYGWERDYMTGRGPLGKASLKAAIETYRIVESHVVPKIEKICTNSVHIKSIVKAHLGRTSEVIHPGVNPKEFRCEGYEKFFLYPSRLVPEKRMELAIEAFAHSRLKGWRLVIAGHHVPSPRNDIYLAKLRRFATGKPVEILVDAPAIRLASLYANCYAVLFTAQNEDWGIVPLESMASEKPVIAINEGGPAESVVDGKTGFLVNSVDEMAEKMRYLADHPGVCEKMGKAGRKHVEQNYTWKVFLDKIDKAFKETAKM